MVAKSRILFSEVWDGVERGANTKIQRVKVQNDIRTSILINTQISPIFNCVTPVSVSLAKLPRQLVVRSNSANAWRASRLFLQKNRTEITYNCSAQCNPSK